MSFSPMSQSYSSSSSFSPNLDLGVSPSTFLMQHPSPEIEKFSPSVLPKLDVLRGDRERVTAPPPKTTPVSPVSIKTRMSYFRKLNLVSFHGHSQEMYTSTEEYPSSSVRRRSTSPTTINVSSAPIAIPRSRQWVKYSAQFITSSSSSEEERDESSEDEEPSLSPDPCDVDDMFVLEM